MSWKVHKGQFSGHYCNPAKSQALVSGKKNIPRYYIYGIFFLPETSAKYMYPLHFNPDINNHYRYTMLDSSDNYVALDEVDEEKDLGVTFQSNLKFDKHIISRNWGYFPHKYSSYSN